MILSVFLSGCAATDQPSAAGNQGAGVSAAQSYCMGRGLKPGSYNYDTCFRNRPEVQAVARHNRLNGNGIIVKNRSVYSSYRGRSYPVE